LTKMKTKNEKATALKQQINMCKASVWSNWLLSTFDFSINFNKFSFRCWMSNCFPFLLNWNRYLSLESTCTISLHMLICCFNAVAFSFFVFIFVKLFSIVSILFQIPISSKSNKYNSHITLLEMCCW
jgi:hypothetical protein